MVSTKTVLSMLVASYALVTRPMEQDVKTPEQDRPLLRLTRQVSKNPVTPDGFVGQELTGQLFRYPWIVDRCKNVLPESYSSEKIIPNEEDTWVSVWATSSESENWGAHGHPNLSERFPQMLPLKLFLKEDKNLKTDGDIVQLTHTDQRKKIVTQIRLILQQRGHRGGHHGTFAECLRVSKDYEKLIKPYIKE